MSLCQWNAISCCAILTALAQALRWAGLRRSAHAVVSLRKSTTDTYLWGRPDSGCLTRARYRHLTRATPDYNRSQDMNRAAGNRWVWLLFACAMLIRNDE